MDPSPVASWAAGRDAFVAKLNKKGAAVLFSYLGGSGDDHGTNIAFDRVTSGTAYAGGGSGSQNFPTNRM